MTSQHLHPNATVLFQGDSITDAGCGREFWLPYGDGYVNFVTAWLTARYPGHRFTFINRGVTGNRISDLEARWSEDCIDLQPDWVSILIGVNDTWRRYDSGIASPIDEFTATYRRLLDRVRAETSAQILLLEPFLLPVPACDGWREDLNPRIDAVRQIAREYATLYVPLDGLFAAACTQQPPTAWAYDGVHPTAAGHALIAQAWLQAMGA